MSNHTPVNHHIVCLKLRATVHCESPALPMMRRNIEAKTPYVAQMTSAAIEASVRATKDVYCCGLEERKFDTAYRDAVMPV